MLGPTNVPNKDFLAGGKRAFLKACKLSRQEDEKSQIAQACCLINGPFFANLLYSQLKLIATHDVPIAATDGFAVYFNPLTFLVKYTVKNQAFAFGHEVLHCVLNDTGMMHVWRKAGFVVCTKGTLPYNQQLMNCAQDFVINAMLVSSEFGEISPDWLYDPLMSKEGKESSVQVYEKLWKQTDGGKMMKPEYLPGGCKPGRSMPAQFDEHMEPGAGSGQDPDKAQAGRSDVEWRIAVAAAANAAALQGKLPASLQRFVGDILEPKQSWQDKLRSAINRRAGPDGYDWTQLDRDMLMRPWVGHQMIGFPMQSVFQAGTIVIGVDVSGSITDPMVNRFFGEMGGIVADLTPKELIVLWCDAKIQRVDELEEPEDLVTLKSDIDKSGAPGGGGTDFKPVFKEIEKRQIEPDLLVFFTDMLGDFPSKAPTYPVVWAATTDLKHSWGDHVRVEL